MTRRRIFIPAVTAAAAIAVSLIAGAPASATEATSQQAPPSIASNESDARYTFGHSAESAVQIGPVDDEMTVDLLDGIDVAACTVANNSSHVIVSYKTWDTGGWWYGDDVDLLCGTDATKGWKHIKARHEGQWQTINAFGKSVGAIPANYAWDDLMDIAILSTFDWPQYSAVLANNKACFVTDLSFYRNDVAVKTWWVQVIVSRNNLDIITAYPRSESQGYLCNG